MDMWGPALVSGQGRERYFLLVVDDYTRYTTVVPLRSKDEVSAVLIPWIRTLRLQLREREGITQSFTLPDSPQQNGIAECRIGLVMETSPTLRWTGKVGDASVFRVWGSCAFVRNTSADKLSALAIPCVFLGFVPDAPGWRFYHPTSRCVLPSQDVTFDKSVPFYHLFNYRSAPPPPPPLFLAPGPPAVDTLPPQGPALSGVSQVDPLPGTVPVQVAIVSGSASGGAELGGAGSEGAGSGGAEPDGVEPRGAESEGAESGAGGPGDTRARGATVTTGAGDPTEPGAAGAGGAGAGVAGVGGPGAGGAEVAGPGVGGTITGGAGGAGAGAVDPGAGGAGGTVRPHLYFVPLLQQVLGVPSSTGLPPPFLCPPPDQSQPPLQLASPLPVPSPYTAQSGGLTEHREPASRPVSPVRTTRSAPRLRPPLVPGTHTMALRPSSVPLRVPLPAPPKSSLPESAAASALVAELLDFAAACSLNYAYALVAESVPSNPPSVGGEFALGTNVLEDRQEDFECLAAAQAAMDAKMASWKSTGTYVDHVPPPGANIVDGMWIFRVKRPPGYPLAFKARYVARGFSQRQGVDYFQTFSPTPKMTTLRVLLHVAAQRDYELHSLDFSTTFLQGTLHEEIWLRRPPGFTGTFPAGTQWSLRRPVYGLRQSPREWHDTLRTTLAALGFVPSTADPSLFLRTDTSLSPFYILVYVLQRFGFQYSSPQLTPLSTSHSLSAPHSDESIELSGPYPELVGCLITSGMGLVLGGRGPVVLTGHVDASWVNDSATQRSSQGYTFSLSSGSVSWRSTRSSSVLSSSCEAEIYAGAMAAQELRWLTCLLTDLGEQPRSPPVMYVDNKAMIALCQEHRLEHRTKHISLRYFLARELQLRGQLLLAYVAPRANTADVFTKALPPGDHQRFGTVLGLLALLCFFS
ncbi:unnamed protein product [Closterium sp. NIES-53]